LFVDVNLKEEKMMVSIRSVSLALLALVALVLGGCGDASKKPNGTKAAKPAAESPAAVAVNWCVEHGVPEDACGQCNAKVAADCKQKGDWCKEHDRPESQCFLCHPELEAKFAAEYEAKNGQPPPKPAGK
jgi:hypothetical protein